MTGFAPLMLLACALPAAAGDGEAPLARLAAGVADEIVRVAGDRAVEFRAIEDRTGRGATFALDLHDLVRNRLSGRVHQAAQGPRLRVEAVVTESPRRLVVSARVTAEPGGELVDVISASVASDRALLPLSPATGSAASSEIEVIRSLRTPPLDGPVIGLALLPDDRLLALAPDSLALYSLEGSGLRLEARRALAGPLEAVRAPGGLLLTSEGTVWALTSRTPEATLFALQEGSRRLVERLRAAALPFPGSASGLRFRPGTNILEGTLPGLGPGPFLAVTPNDPSVAVDVEGRLRVASPSGPGRAVTSAGPALALLWPGVLAAASAAPPGAPDAILLFELGQGELRLIDTLPVPGAVRALAGASHETTARLVGALDEAEGTRLLVLDVRRVSP